MSAPIIWILIPLAIAGLLIILNARTKLTGWIAAISCALLAILAGVVTIGTPIRVASLTIDISDTLVLLGRRLVLNDGDQGFLAMFYTLGAVWFLGAQTARANRLFVPLGMMMLALLVAARSVEPFLYAALLVEMAVLISLPMLSPPGTPTGKGLMRYLVFQTLAMPFILLAGWVFRSIEANPADEGLYLQAALLLGLGFAIWLAAFPFFTWMPLLADETHPYVVGFVLSALPTVVLFYSLDFFNGFAWLRDAALLPAILQVTGSLMVIIGGGGAAFQNNLSRAFSYAVIMETGFALLAVSLKTELGLYIFAAAFLPRLLAFWVWSYSLSNLSQFNIPLTLTGVTGLFHRYPIQAVGLAVSWLSLAGLPLLGSFPLRQTLLESLAVQSLPIALWALLGGMGLLFSVMRASAVMVQSNPDAEHTPITWQQGTLLIIGMLVLTLTGIFPNVFLQGLTTLVKSFTNLP